MSIRRIGGVLNLKCTTANGGSFYLELRGKWKLTPSRTKKEGIAGQDRVHGYKEMPVVPTMEGDVSYNQELDVRRLDEATGVTATLELANGKNLVRNRRVARRRVDDRHRGGLDPGQVRVRRDQSAELISRLLFGARCAPAASDWAG